MQQYCNHNQQMALPFYDPAMVSGTAAQGQSQQTQPQVPYKYPPTLYTVFQRHITVPHPLLANPRQPPHRAQTPPRRTISCHFPLPQTIYTDDTSIRHQINE